MFTSESGTLLAIMLDANWPVQDVIRSLHLQATQMSLMSKQRRNGCPWHFLPLFLGITSAIGLLATYFIAKMNCHIEKWLLPYVSYTGTENPESSIFGLIFNVEGFLGLLIVILVWRLVRQLDIKSAYLQSLNKITFVTGFLGCIGVIVVANFQVSRYKTPHYIGAALALIVGTFYCIFSSILTYKMHKASPGFSSIICALRFLAAALMVLSIISLIILFMGRNNYKKSIIGTYRITNLSYPVSFKFPNGSCVPIINSVPVKIRYMDLAMSISEWVLTVCLLFSLSLYAYEFKYFDGVKIILKQGGNVLTSLHSRNDYISPTQLQPLDGSYCCSCNLVTCNHHCGNTSTSAEDSENEVMTDAISNSELVKFKNNNTEVRYAHKFNRADAQKVSKSLPDISRNACDTN